MLARESPGVGLCHTRSNHAAEDDVQSGATAWVGMCCLGLRSNWSRVLRGTKCEPLALGQAFMGNTWGGSRSRFDTSCILILVS